MTDTARPARHTRRGTVGVACVLALAGLLFTSNASLARSSDERSPQNLADLVQAESARAEGLAAEVDGLRTEVDTLTDDGSGAGGQLVADPLVDLAAGRVEVTGPGLVVELTDAPRGPTRPGVAPDDLVVHQQDLQAVINALWAGGAEAMTLQGQRVVSTSAFRCVGNVLLLHGRTYSPPYVVAAIGDTTKMRTELERAPGVQIYLEYVRAVGLGWSVVEDTTLRLPAYEGAIVMEHATIPEGTSLSVREAA